MAIKKVRDRRGTLRCTDTNTKKFVKCPKSKSTSVKKKGKKKASCVSCKPAKKSARKSKKRTMSKAEWNLIQLGLSPAEARASMKTGIKAPSRVSRPKALRVKVRNKRRTFERGIYTRDGIKPNFSRPTTTLSDSQIAMMMSSPSLPSGMPKGGGFIGYQNVPY